MDEESEEEEEKILVDMDYRLFETEDFQVPCYENSLANDLLKSILKEKSQ